MPVITPTVTAPSNSLVIKPTTDATTAIQLADKDGNAILTVDTVNNTLTGVTLVAPALGTPASGDLQNCTAATATTKGVVELDTDAEAVTGEDTERALTAANLKAVLGHEYTYPIQEIVEYSRAQNCPTLLVEAFLSTPSSANLKAAVSDETGSGALVFADLS